MKEDFMRLRRISALVLAAAVATTMLTGCPWDKEEEPGSSSSSSSSSSSRPSYDDGNEDDGRPDKPDKPEEPDEPEEPDAPDITLGEGATIVSQTYDKESNSFTVVFSVASKDGYKITSVTVAIDGTAQTLTPGEDGNYTFSLPAGAESCTVNVTYTEDLGYDLSADGKTYEVYSDKGLAAWADAVAKDKSINCTLTSNITVSSWTAATGYTGTFDGAGHTIAFTGTYSKGLFNKLEGGTVKDLTLDLTNASIDTNATYIGGIAGENNNGTITGCTVMGGDFNVAGLAGGIAGQNKGRIENCRVTGSSVITTSGYSGGITGYNNAGGTITNCTVQNATIQSTSNAGGIAGRNQNSNATITGCVAEDCQISADNYYAGGVVGYCNSTMSGCAAVNCTVTALDSYGEVAGADYNVTACYWGDETGVYQGNGIETPVDNWAAAIADMNSHGAQFDPSASKPTVNFNAASTTAGKLLQAARLFGL